MWEEKQLRIPKNTQSVICSSVMAHPWVFGLGQEESSGFYLSPPNAVEYLVKRLASAPVAQDVTALMFTATTLPAFVSTLATAAQVFPLPALTQLQRRAATAAQLATTKMQLPARPGGLPPAAALSLATTRQAYGAQNLIAAAGEALLPGAPAEIESALASLATLRATLLQEALDTLELLQAGSVPVWAVSAEGSTQLAISRLRDNIPNPDAIFTAAMLFVGDDLTPLRDMVVNP
ncbi:hypothetical protein ACTWOG_000982 [Serratia marcescens]